MDREPIAIVGMGAMYPGASSVPELWRAVVEGRDQVREVPASRWRVDEHWAADPRADDRTYSRRGGFIDDVLFDPVEWGIPPAAMAATDPVQLLTLLVAKQALRDALGGAVDAQDRDRVGVFIGASGATQLATTMAARLQRPAWRRGMVAAGVPAREAEEICDRIAGEYPPWSEDVFPGYLNNVIAGRVANRLGFRGTNCTMDAACASSLAALKMAIQELWLGDADLAIAGGADALCDPLGFLSFAKCSALSRSDDCRPFSSKADGTIISEGVGLVVLERLADAERNGRRIYAVIRGIGSSSDGRGTAIYAPSEEGQALAMRRAYRSAGVGPETVELLEAHGTGTPAGELAEVRAARQVFEASGRTDRGWCALGSIKSQIGHTKAAAGVAGIIKAALALHGKVLPPTIKIEEPNPALDLAASPFHVSTRSRPWVRAAAHPRRAAVSSFGFGGANFHVVLEEHTASAGRGVGPRGGVPELMIVTGADEAAVAAECLRLAGELELEPASLAERARQARAAYTHAARVRVAIVGEEAPVIAARLRDAARRLAGEIAGSVPGVALGIGAHEGRVAFLFPGQGSQYVGMGGAIAMTYPEALGPWDRAAGVELERGRRLHDLVFPPPAFTEEGREAQQRALTATEWAQPALAVASLSWLRLLERAGVRPDCVAGHSFGELVALHAAGVYSDADLLKIARRRGELMRDASGGEGAMTAVAAAHEAVMEAIEGVDGVVMANHNAPAQVVISGRVGAIELAERALGARGLAHARLPVGSAFHSPLVASCVAPLEALLQEVELTPPLLEVYGNATAAPYPDEVARIPAVAARQLAEPVRFVDEILAMHGRGVRTFVEVGPRQVLTRLVSATLGDRPHRAIAVDDGSGGLAAWVGALAQLVAAGVPLRPAELDADQRAEERDAVGAQGSKAAIRINGALSTLTSRAPRASVAAPSVQAPQRGELHALPVSGAPRSAQPAQPVGEGSRDASGAARPVASAARSPETVLRRRLLEVHERYQAAMAEAQAAFLESAGASLEVLAGRQSAARGDAPAASSARAPSGRAAGDGSRGVRGREGAAVAEPHVAPRPAAVADEDAMGLLLAVVSDKTGFPIEAIAPEMDLERDLGIDSIKRVEILTELRRRSPALAALERESLATRRTLKEIGGLLAGGVPTTRAVVHEPARSGPPGADGREGGGTPAIATSGEGRSGLVATLQAIVSEKTGFPVDLIHPDMDLQQDLGVDSIKRVEVLVAIRSRLPALAALQTNDLAHLKTVGQIGSFLSSRAEA